MPVMHESTAAAAALAFSDRGNAEVTGYIDTMARHRLTVSVVDGRVKLAHFVN
jgi:hypothetical protein